MSSRQRAGRRIVRYIVIPALLVALQAISEYLQRGSFAVDWNVVAVVTVTAALAGISKWLRDEFGLDAKVV